MVFADFDADGDLDLAAAFYHAGVAAIAENLGDGQFGVPSEIARDGASAPVVGDFDEDGDPDVAVTRPALESLSAHFNEGGRFPTALVIPVARRVFNMVAADLDDDGKVDLAGTGSQDLSLVLSRGKGAFAEPVRLTGFLDALFLVAADFNGDRSPDLVVTQLTSTALLLNVGRGNFTPLQEAGLPMLLGRPLPGDLDGDGDLDLAGPQASGVMVLVNQGLAIFEGRLASLDLRSAARPRSGPHSLAYFDVDSNGLPDIFVAAGEEPAFLRNAGGARFAVGALMGTDHAFPWGVVAADLDGNGEADVLAAPWRDASLAVLQRGLVGYGADCNGNRIPDECDVVSGASLDENRTGAPDECEPRFAVSVEGLPEVIRGAPGEVRTVEAYAVLTTRDNPTPDGVQGWAVSLIVEGAHIQQVTVKGLPVATIFDDDGQPQTAPIDHELDLQNAMFRFAQRFPVESEFPGAEGAVSSIVLHFSQKMVLRPNGTERILKLTLEVTIPNGEECAPVSLQYYFRPETKSASLRTASTVITFAGKSFHPEATGATARVCKVQPFVRCDATADSKVDIADPIWILTELFGKDTAPATACPEAADCNGDGQEDISDPIYALSSLFLGGPPPPRPFPTCGAAEVPGGPLPCPFGSTSCP